MNMSYIRLSYLKFQSTMRFSIVFVLFASTSLSSFSQEIVNNSELKLPEIMKGNEFIGHQPNNIRWTYDGDHIIFDWNPDNEPGDKAFIYSLKSNETTVLNPKFINTNCEYYGVSNESKHYHYFSHNGALYQYDIKGQETYLVFKSDKAVRNIVILDKGFIAYFQNGSDLYKYDLNTMSTQIVVQFKKGEKPIDKEEINYLEKEELELFEFHQDNKEKKEWNEEQNEIWSDEITKVYQGNHSVSNVQISPDERFVTYRLNKYPDNDGTHVEHHISADGHTYTSNARSKVSEKDPSHKLGVYDLKNDTTYFIDFSSLDGIRKKPEYYSEYGDTEPEFSEDRKIIMHKLIYSIDGYRNVLDIRSYDNKDRWIVSLNLNKGEIDKVYDHQHDEAWIGGPGISSWNMVSGALGWLDEEETIYFQSEETGYSHLYSVDVYNGEKAALTSGNWEVHNAELSKDKSKFFITANKTHPGDRGFYHLILKDKSLVPILTNTGNHEVSVSRDEKTLAVRYSNKTTPWELYTAPNVKNSALKRITKSTTNAFDSYEWCDPDVITFKASDGVNVNARLYEPEEGKANGAAVIFVHGAGYLQNAHNFWSGYYREYMFHNLLRDNGYTILDIDYRASKGYGRDFRTGIYRHMGGKDLSDQMDGRQFLIDSLGIDENRVGIYGGSYGGFITLMALLNEPGKFQAGAAIRSVTDWNHYNHEYTSNILNYPTTDPDAYKKSSPIYFADNLEDRLIMLHGMVDDNVQFQDVVRLSQRFIELGKINWELAAYPVEPHGFKKASSWTDEYGRIYKLFYEELILNAQ